MYDLITIPDVRAEGLDVAVVGDGRLSAIIVLASQYVQRVTGQVFRPVTYDASSPLVLDGSGGQALPLPMPVLELLTCAEEGQVYTLDELAVYSRAFGGEGDERLYPRIVKRSMTASAYLPPLFGRLTNGAKWVQGPQAVELTGTFGFLDGRWRGAWGAGTAYLAGDTVTSGLQTYLALAGSTGVAPASDDGTTWQAGAAPALIRRVAIDLVLREYRLKTDPEYAAATQRARVKSETTDMHRYELGGLVSSGLWTGDPNIDDVLAMYKRRYGGNTGVGA